MRNLVLKEIFFDSIVCIFISAIIFVVSFATMATGSGYIDSSELLELIVFIQMIAFPILWSYLIFKRDIINQRVLTLIGINIFAPIMFLYLVMQRQPSGIAIMSLLALFMLNLFLQQLFAFGISIQNLIKSKYFTISISIFVVSYLILLALTKLTNLSELWINLILMIGILYWSILIRIKEFTSFKFGILFSLAPYILLGLLVLKIIASIKINDDIDGINEISLVLLSVILTYLFLTKLLQPSLRPAKNVKRIVNSKLKNQETTIIAYDTDNYTDKTFLVNYEYLSSTEKTISANTISSIFWKIFTRKAIFWGIGCNILIALGFFVISGLSPEMGLSGMFFFIFTGGFIVGSLVPILGLPEFMMWILVPFYYFIAGVTVWHVVGKRITKIKTPIRILILLLIILLLVPFLYIIILGSALN